MAYYISSKTVRPGLQHGPKRAPSSPMRARGHVLEDVRKLGKPEAVDRAAGIIRGVKILGPSSKNGRRYTERAMTAAKGLYEGRGVNADHPLRPGDARSVNDRFGWFENVKIRPAGLFGDFHVLDPQDPLAKKLFTAAEQRPDLFGFSHNCLAEGAEDAAGIFVVESITEVRSVDLVVDPATTDGLFESKGRQPTPAATLTRRALVERLTGRKLREADTEGDGMNDLPDVLNSDETPPAASAWRDAAAKLVGKLVASDDPEAHDMAKMLSTALQRNDASAATEGLIRTARRLVNRQAIVEDRRKSAARRVELIRKAGAGDVDAFVRSITRR